MMEWNMDYYRAWAAQEKQRHMERQYQELQQRALEYVDDPVAFFGTLGNLSREDDSKAKKAKKVKPDLNKLLLLLED